MRRPASPDFSGWNCTPTDVAALHGRGKRRAVLGRGDASGVTGRHRSA